MKKLPTGLQNFKVIITSDYLYVDKTRQIFELINDGRLYFLSRPRRFGKSILVSTLNYIFSGERALFEGLYIAEQTDYDWQSYPIVKFSFNSFGYKTTDLRNQLGRQLKAYAEAYDLPFENISLTEQFKNLIEGIAKKEKPPVVLVDEYDKTIVDFLTDGVHAKENQAILKDFFSPLKHLDANGYLRFLFITGVSKFSKVSLFSDLNNLVDLSLSPEAHDLTGITQAELEDNFPDHIRAAAQSFKIAESLLLEKVKFWYNGYSFEGNTRLYNPFSLLNFFGENRFRNFWFATGTPTFLVEEIRNRQINPQHLTSIKVTEAFFDKFSLENLDIIGLLFQTGYLTIKEIILNPVDFSQDYVLGYPNEEVRRALIHNLLEAFTYQPASTVGTAVLRMKDGLKTNDLPTFIDHLKILLSDLSYFHQPKSKKEPTEKDEAKTFAMWEGYFHTIIYLITSFVGLEVKTEISKHKGRLDLIAETEDYLYLMEFKLDETADNAIQQIKEREYAAAYRDTSKTLILLGVGFSRVERNVESWESEVWKR